MSQSKYLLREQPKSKFDGNGDWVPSQGRKKQHEEKVVCIKCHVVFKSKMKLEVHEKTCLRLEETDSFLKFAQLRVVLSDVGQKIAFPSSQDSQQNENDVDTEAQL